MPKIGRSLIEMQAGFTSESAGCRSFAPDRTIKQGGGHVALIIFYNACDAKSAETRRTGGHRQGQAEDFSVDYHSEDYCGAYRGLSRSVRLPVQHRQAWPQIREQERLFQARWVFTDLLCWRCD